MHQAQAPPPGKAQTFNRWRQRLGTHAEETVSALAPQLGGHPPPKATGAETIGPASPSCPLGEPEANWGAAEAVACDGQVTLPEIPPFPSCLLPAPGDSSWASVAGGRKGLNQADGPWLGIPRCGCIKDRNKTTISAPGAGPVEEAVAPKNVQNTWGKDAPE